MQHWDLKVYPHTQFGIPTLNNIGDMLRTPATDTIFLGLRPEVKVTVTGKQYATHLDPNVYPHTEFGISTSNNIGDMLRTQFF